MRDIEMTDFNGILAALGNWTMEKSPEMREGVK